MREKIIYEFQSFRLDPSRRILICDNQVVAVSAKPFELLLALIENYGRTVVKEDLIKRVWPNTTVMDRTFHVTLASVRKALGEKGREPYYIVRTAAGYKFVGDVREISLTAEENDWDSQTTDVCMPSHAAHVLTVGLLYGAYYVVSLLVEVMYQFDRFGRSALKVAPLVFLGMAVSATTSLEVDRRLTQNGRDKGLLASVIFVLFTAAILFGLMTFFVPSFPITESVLQTYPAQAAFLKDMTYIVLLVILFVILPFHFIVATQRRLARDKNYTAQREARANQEQHLPYWSFWALAILLVVFLIMSVMMTARLLDNLKPNPYHNLFVQLAYLRGALFFGLGIYCLVWYRTALNGIKKS
jgi:DNA-binding winged helix-turn-helix (wHTH) protein